MEIDMTDKPIIATELLKGQGLGNQLFCYVTTRCVAMRNGCDYSILGGETLANNIHSQCGLYFMDLDLGIPTKKEDFKEIYNEKENRLYVGNSKHDIEHGAYVSGTDEELLNMNRTVLVYGNMQAQDYYMPYKEDICKWLKVKPEYECYDYSQEDLCIIHLRCSDYMDSPELFLSRKYWKNGMRNMRKINPHMRFMIITNDVKEAEKMIPGVKAYNFDLAKDYSIIKNAKYLLLANSSFTYFPAFTSTTVKTVIAPKYWARHNVSDGYWASEQNIYDGFTYQDRKGRLFTAQECREELLKYKNESAQYAKLNKPMTQEEASKAYKKAKRFYNRYRVMHYINSAKRKIRMAVGR
jgi:hypothetical protein